MIRFTCKHEADWKGRRKLAFNLWQFKWQYGRECYKTNCHGETVAWWWEWEV